MTYRPSKGRLNGKGFVNFSFLSRAQELKGLRDLAPTDNNEPCPKCGSRCRVFNLARQQFCRRCSRPVQPEVQT